MYPEKEVPMKSAFLILLIIVAQFAVMYWLLATKGAHTALIELGVFLVGCLVFGTVRRLMRQG